MDRVAVAASIVSFIPKRRATREEAVRAMTNKPPCLRFIQVCPMAPLFPLCSFRIVEDRIGLGGEDEPIRRRCVYIHFCGSNS